MIPNRALTVVDNLLRDITQIQLPFGGKTFVFGGDFRQILPVVPNGGKNETIANSIKKSVLWKHFKVLKLTINMRASESSQDFRDFLLDIGNGTYPNSLNIINIPERYLITPSSNIISEIFGSDVNNILRNPQLFSSRAILCPKNIECDIINKKLLI